MDSECNRRLEGYTDASYHVVATNKGLITDVLQQPVGTVLVMSIKCWVPSQYMQVDVGFLGEARECRRWRRGTI